MFDRQTAPLAIAMTVLTPETIRDVKSWGYTSRAFSILDRWAMNSPEELKKLESQGGIALDLRLYEQQQKETQVLNGETARLARMRGMSDWEILENSGIETQLRISA